MPSYSLGGQVLKPFMPWVVGHDIRMVPAGRAKAEQHNADE
jgi:hypothetical protein